MKRGVLPIILLCVSALASCRSNPEDSDDNRFPPVVRGSGMVHNIAFRLPCAIARIQAILTDPRSGKIAYRTASRPDEDGITLLVSRNTTVVAAAAGRVESLYRQADGRGFVVFVRHASRVATRCSGLATIQVEAGQEVAAGSVLGTCRGRLRFSVLARTGSFFPRLLPAYLDRTRGIASWTDLFPVLLLFGEGVFREQLYQ